MGKGDRVIRFEEVIVMLNVFSNNFFHQLVELLPAILQIVPILESNQTSSSLQTRNSAIRSC